MFTKKERTPEELIKNPRNSNINLPNDHEKIEMNFLKKIEKMNFALPSKKEKKIKKNTATIWISEEFPLKFNVFLNNL